MPVRLLLIMAFSYSPLSRRNTAGPGRLTSIRVGTWAGQGSTGGAVEWPPPFPLFLLVGQQFFQGLQPSEFQLEVFRKSVGEATRGGEVHFQLRETCGLLLQQSVRPF